MEVSKGSHRFRISMYASTQFVNALDIKQGGDEALGKDKDILRKLSLIRCLNIIFKQQRKIWPLFLFGIISSAAGGTLFPAQAVLFESSVPTLQLPRGDHLVHRGNFWALMYFAFSLSVFVCYL